jgi:hypothetical protein
VKESCYYFLFKFGKKNNESELKLARPTPNGISTRKALHDTDLKRKLPNLLVA